MWYLQSEDQQPENLDGQIEEILGKVTSNMEVWQTLPAGSAWTSSADYS